MIGRFITIEGVEGSGKTTNLPFIRAWLEASGVELVISREPGGTPLAERIRDLVIDRTQMLMSHDTELLLMFAARAQHLHEVIKPALAAGRWVLCDRFTDATYAYQGGGRGIEEARISALESWIQGALRPDLTLYLDVPVAIGLERAAAHAQPDRFEQEQIDFFERVRCRYLDIVTRESQRCRIINAAQPLDRVREDIQIVLSEFMEHDNHK